MADFYDKLSKNKYSDIKPLKLGNIYSERDWSHAEDIIDGIWRMLNQDVYNENISSKIKEKIKIDNIMRVVTRQEDLNELIIKNIKDYVVSSGKTCSIKFILEKFFKMIGVFGYWSGEKLEEKFYATSFNGKEFSKKIILVEVDEKFYRPLDVQHLCGDSSKIRKDLGWEPKYNIDLFVKDILDSDIKNYAKE
jgi:GDPmannose 4,6-dehydratase